MTKLLTGLLGAALLVPVVASAQESIVRGRVLYNPALPDCFQLVPCVGDLALTRPEDWRPPKSAERRGAGHHVERLGRPPRGQRT
jgi:hypothetical protein